jgi:hypothetical protein
LSRFSQIAIFSVVLVTIAATELEFLTASLTSALLLSSEMILTIELRLSNEPHSGSSPPQPLNKSKAENNHKADACSLLRGFIGMLTTHGLSCAIAQAGEN